MPPRVLQTLLRQSLLSYAAFSLPLPGLQPAPAPQLQPGQSALFDGLLHQAPTWDDIAWLRSITRLPVLLKGVLHPADATQAVAAGAAGVIVSNHGGRTLDTAPATATALPRVVQAVDGAVPVLVDGGIRRGAHVEVAGDDRQLRLQISFTWESKFHSDPSQKAHSNTR